MHNPSVHYPSTSSPEGVHCSQDTWARIGRLSLPWALFAYPFYLWKRSPGKEGSHFDPECDLFTPGERNMVRLQHTARWHDCGNVPELA